MEKKISKRIEIIDLLRGFAIINMIIYHFIYSMVFVFGVELDFFSIESWYPYQQSIAWNFILLSGFSTNLSKKPIKNGLIVLASAAIVSIVTYLATPNLMIRFGVLHFMGVSILIVGVLRDLLKKINPHIGIVFSFFIFFYLWRNGVSVFPFYSTFTRLNLFFLGFPGIGFSSSDYFPLLPWFFLFLTGFYLGILNEKYGNILSKIKLEIPVINFFGRHSLIIYLLHQGIIFICLTFLRKIGII